MTMYKPPNRKFTREQIVFVVDVALSAAFDVVFNSLATNEGQVERHESERQYDGLEDLRCGAQNTAMQNIAIFYAQTTDDGISPTDIPFIYEFIEICTAFKEKVYNDHVFDQKHPDFRQLAEKIADELWEDYI